MVTLRCRNGTCGGARIGVDQTLAWFGEWCGLGCQLWIVGSVQFPPGTRIKSANTEHKWSLT